MKTSLLLTILFFSIKPFFAQDTLDCKKDLMWESKERFYYLSNDATKAKVTGPAKCYPQKEYENRGYLKNGAWEGIVYGYKADKLIGKVNYKAGILHGFDVRYDENNKVIDSAFYNEGNLTYQKKHVRDSNLDIKRIEEFKLVNDTAISVRIDYDNNEPQFYDRTSYLKNKKEGLFIQYNCNGDLKQEDDFDYFLRAIYHEGKLVKKINYEGNLPIEEEFYTDGKLVKRITYSNNQGDFGKADKIESEINFLNKKRHGEAKFYADGKLEYIQIYKKGKSKETKFIEE